MQGFLSFFPFSAAASAFFPLLQRLCPFGWLHLTELSSRFFIALNKINDYINTEQNRNIELGNMTNEFIEIKGAREHNLKDVDISIPKNKLTVITGLSGSGKSSLAFDTVYAEGQRRYVESLSSYARQFLDLMKNPKLIRLKVCRRQFRLNKNHVAQSPFDRRHRY